MTRTLVVVAGLSILLQACGATPTQTGRSPDEPVPELTLNLPQAEDCSCAAGQSEQPDYTFLERGFNALVEGEHIEAVQHFQRYQRLEKVPEAGWEAGIAIAYVSTLPNSPFYDPAEARKSYRRLAREFSADMQVHEKTLLMRDSLETFVVMDRHIADLESNNATLRADLEKREAALKRLRELTLAPRE